MRPQLLTLLLASCLAVPATRSLTAQTASVDTRLATQNALFEEQWQASLKNNPERATAVGDYRYNDQLADYSLTRITQQNAENRAYLVRLTAIDTTVVSQTPAPQGVASQRPTAATSSITAK